jgi:predicted CxxxxCH...CXXCH cytochrome family protein
MTLLLNLLACLTAEERPEPACTACHGTEGVGAGPPAALGGVTDPAHRGVGAHERHREPSVSLEVPCPECHLVPRRLDDPGHVDTEWPAEVGWGNGDIAKLRAEPFDADAQTCAVYCHSASGAGEPEPSWTGGPMACTSCHGDPPPPPHPEGDTACAECHAAGGSANPTAHVDGVVQYDVEGVACELCHGTPPPPSSRHPSADLPCSDCHEGGGSENPAFHLDGVLQMNADQVPCYSCHGVQGDAAPPLDTYSQSDTVQRTVGAHQTHVDGTATSAAVPCGTCHQVPALASDPGHIDAPPSEVLVDFDGVSCATTCHDRPGAANPDPLWNVVDGTQAECGDCHGNPPPTPVHDGTSNCACHGAGGPDDPARHVDGTVDL